MCLAKDQTKRPTAEKLLKHSFFKHAKPPELSLKSILAGLPPLWERVKALQVSHWPLIICFFFFQFDDVTLLITEVYFCLQLKDAAQLALKKMPSAEQEALSLVGDLNMF